MLPIELIGMAICFCAVIAITLSSSDGGVVEEESSISQDHRTLGYILIICGAWIFATTNVLNRVLKELHHALVMFYYSAFGFPLFVVIMVSQALISDNHEILIF